jgi:hypothetical protein
MNRIKNNGDRFRFAVPENLPEEVTAADEELFLKITSQDLSPEQVDWVLTPPDNYPREKYLLAVHWHPEFVPLDLISRRIAAMFPNISDSLIIPTQHNELMSLNAFSGVEIDCYSRGFNQKVQLLLHFKNEDVEGEKAGMLKSMLAHTFKYRASQLFDYIHTIIKPVEERIHQAAAETGSDEGLMDFVRIQVRKIHELLDRHMDHLPPMAIKNKLLWNFFDALRPVYGDSVINRAQTYITAVKRIVKANFSNKYFYRTSEVIEEVRSLSGGVVIPHPEQFWPILLAEYDVDGYEVWNPQSRRYTEFLIKVLNDKNKVRSRSQRELLIFMGDDTHMGEKTKEPALRHPEKGSREIGRQDGWEDLSVCKQLICANMDKEKIISEYRSRLLQ